MMKKVTFIFILLIAGVVFSCSIVPFTGRKQLSIVPESEMIAMGLAANNRCKEDK